MYELWEAKIVSSTKYLVHFPSMIDSFFALSLFPDGNNLPNIALCDTDNNVLL